MCVNIWMWSHLFTYVKPQAPGLTPRKTTQLPRRDIHYHQAQTLRPLTTGTLAGLIRPCLSGVLRSNVNPRVPMYGLLVQNSGKAS